MRWNLHSNAGDVLALGPRTAGRLATVGIQTVAELVAAQPNVVARRLNDRAISAETLAEWQREAQLVVDLPALPSSAARLLAAAGFAEADKILRCTPTELLAAIESAQQEKPTSWLAHADLPTVGEVSLWIQIAGQTQNSFAA